jgi:hypothetical protein
MAHVIKDNVSNGTPIPVLPTGEQQIVVSTREIFKDKILQFLIDQGRLSYTTNDRR